MRLTHVRLLVRDVAASVAYYRDALGLEVTLEAGDIYAELRAGAAFAELVGRGALVARGPQDHAEAVLRSAHLRDPDGNLIEINAPLAQ